MQLETREVQDQERSTMLCYAMLCYEGSTLLSIKLESNKDFKDTIAH